MGGYPQQGGSHQPMGYGHAPSTAGAPPQMGSHASSGAPPPMTGYGQAPPTSQSHAGMPPPQAGTTNENAPMQFFNPSNFGAQQTPQGGVGSGGNLSRFAQKRPTYPK